MVKLEPVKHFLFPGSLRNGITTAIGCPDGIPQRLRLCIVRPQFYFQGEFHNTREGTEKPHKNLNQLKKGIVAPFPPSTIDEWAS
jgi:hypothetical protein